ncbi:hypothetical protein NHQ30_011577 [Ciborinia camelliae]|nr:hypothetical protein NHQ30_011577 [Ciborinia camelliae]
MILSREISWFLLPVAVQAGAATYSVPSTAPNWAAKLSAAPVGLSFEFFAFPQYFTKVAATHQCLANLKALSGTWPPIRIGGTTQFEKLWGLTETKRDRATYDPNERYFVEYNVASPADAPASLKFGPSFMKLASQYGGSVVIGLNRAHNDIQNTIAAAKVAKSSIRNLKAIELGNEPEYWPGANQPIASHGWSPAMDAASQNSWDVQVGTALGANNIIQAGNSNSGPPTWGAAELIASGDAHVRSYVRDYAHHNYPGGNVQQLMSHSGIVGNLAAIGADARAATAVGKEYVLGETNSVAGGGAATVSPTFGAAIWTLDYALHATTLNIKNIYYHQGTIGNCFYCFWGRYSAGAPYYGAWLAASAFAGSSYIQQIDTGNSNYAVYILYNNARAPLKAVLINSDYYDGTGHRGSESFTLRGLHPGYFTRSKRLTAPNALSRVDKGSSPTFGGQKVADGSCAINGFENFELGRADGAGTVTFTLAASEALLVHF